MAQHGIGDLSNLHLARVTDNADPDGRGRVKVRLLALDMEVWAALITPSAGAGYGVALSPKIDEVVVIGFVTPELPLVLGSLWSGAATPPAAANPAEGRYAVATPAGTVMLFDDDEGPRIELTTPAGHRVELSDAGGGRCTVEVGAGQVTVTSDKVEVVSGNEVTVQATTATVQASQLTVNAGLSKFSGVVQCDSLVTNSVVSSTYSPGAGNIW